MFVTFLSWSLFVAHSLFGNLLVFIGGGLFTVAILGALAVSVPTLRAPTCLLPNLQHVLLICTFPVAQQRA